MIFDIEFTQTAADHVRGYRKFDQKIILDSIEEQLRIEPGTETKHRKRLGENELSDLELRIGDFRAFYDIIIEENRSVVRIKGVGHRIHDKLFIAGTEVQL